MYVSSDTTFSSEPFDRAAHLRNATAQAELLMHKDAQSIVLWRGKPLFDTENSPTLDWLPLTHPLMAEAVSPPIFLGLDGDAPRFAHDISTWEDPNVDALQMGNFLDQSQNRHPSMTDTQAFLELRAVMSGISAMDAGTAATAKGIWGWHEGHQFCAKCGGNSEITLAGWQRTCRDCGASHFPRTDPVVIMLITRGNKVLMGRSPGWPEGMYSLLAGFMEPGESIESAVRREVFEESGVTVGKVGYLASQPWPFPASLMIGCWGHATSDEIKIDPVEIEDAMWITREDLMDAQHEENPKIRPARKGALAHHLIHMWLRDEV